MRVSLVLLNANVITMDPAGPRAEAVAVAGERVAAVGGNGEIRRMGSRGARVVDCQGLTLLPGFNDAHCICWGWGGGCRIWIVARMLYCVWAGRRWGR